MADYEFINHAHTPMQLYCRLPDTSRGLAHIGFGSRDNSTAFGRVLGIDFDCRKGCHRACLVCGNHHVDHAMLQGLKTPDGLTELFACFQVVKRHFVQCFQYAHGLGTHCNDGVIDRAFNMRQCVILGAERGGHVAATMYSLIGTCRLNGVEPNAWLCDVLKRLPNHPVTKLAELLPYNWQRQFTNQT